MNVHCTQRPVRLAYIVLLAALVWGAGYIRRGLWEPDEARYAYVAWEMQYTGDWAVPHRHGEYYAHKPPLMFWLINLFSLITGGSITSLSARLPSLLGAVLSLWATARLAERWIGTRAAWRSVLVLCTSYLFWQCCGWGQIDALLCGLQMLAIYALVSDNNSPSVWRPLVAFGSMGLAVLAKGPVGFIVPAGAYIACMIAAGEARRLRRWYWVWGPAVTLAFPALWLLWAWQSGAPQAYLNELLFTQNVDRVVSGHALGHPRPLYYFLYHFPLDILPWTLFIPGTYMALRSQPDWAPVRRRLTAWIIFVVVFFSILSSKRGLYVLLAHPAAAILIGAGWQHLPKGKPSRTGVVGAGLLALLGLAAVGAIGYPHLPLHRLLLLPPGVMFLVASFFLFRMARQEGLSSAWFYTFSVTLLVVQFYVSTVIYPACNYLKTPVELVAATKGKLAPPQRLYLYRMQGEIMAFYTGVQGKMLRTPEELVAEVKAHPTGFVVTPEKEWMNLEKQFAALPPAHRFRMGSKTLVWCRWE